MSKPYPDDMSMDKLLSMKLPEGDELLAFGEQVLAYLADSVNPSSEVFKKEMQAAVERHLDRQQETWNRRN